MSTVLMIVGASVALLGLVLIPLPGPGYPLLALGVILFLVGVVARMAKRGQNQTS